MDGGVRPRGASGPRRAWWQQPGASPRRVRRGFAGCRRPAGGQPGDRFLRSAGRGSFPSRRAPRADVVVCGRGEGVDRSHIARRSSPEKQPDAVVEVLPASSGRVISSARRGVMHSCTRPRRAYRPLALPGVGGWASAQPAGPCLPEPDSVAARALSRHTVPARGGPARGLGTRRARFASGRRHARPAAKSGHASFASGRASPRQERRPFAEGGPRGPRLPPRNCRSTARTGRRRRPCAQAPPRCSRSGRGPARQVETRPWTRFRGPTFLAVSASWGAAVWCRCGREECATPAPGSA